MKANLAVALIGAVLVSLPAAAQTTPPASTAQKSTTSNANATPLYEMKAGQFRATKLAGVPVYTSKFEQLGSVSDLILDQDGKTGAVVIGVGGMLGMGQHLVAVPYDQVKWIDRPPPSAVSSGSSTTGSGSSAAPSEPSGPGPSATGGATGMGSRPATAPGGASTSGASTSGATQTASTDAFRGYPDHAVVDMTADQLKALPAVTYAR